MSIRMLQSATRLPTTFPSFTRRMCRKRQISVAAQMAPYTLYTWGTPNGWKAHIVLEELGLDYKVESIDISSNKQKEDWFLKINPNGRIPAIVDHDSGDLSVFETGAIMWYLVQKHDTEGTFWPKDLSKQAKVMSWLMFQMGGVGPMQGQANHFVRYAKPQIKYGMTRYSEETTRLYSLLESTSSVAQPAPTNVNTKNYIKRKRYQLETHPMGYDVTPAEMGVNELGVTGVDYKQFPKLAAWVQKIYERPAAKKALSIPKQSDFAKLLEDDEHYAKVLAEGRQKIADAKEI